MKTFILMLIFSLISTGWAYALGDSVFALIGLVAVAVSAILVTLKYEEVTRDG